MPPGAHWMVWRPVLAGKATLLEIETHYSLRDLAMLNDVMDLDDEIQARTLRQYDRP